MVATFEGLGTEALIDVVFAVFKEEYNTVLQKIGSEWAEWDAERVQRLGTPVETVDLEPVNPDSFHYGSIPSFVSFEDKYEQYPMAVIMPGRTIQDTEDARSDQLDVYANLVAIHLFARAQKVDEGGFNLCYRRASRMAEAAVELVKNNAEITKTFGRVKGPSMVDRTEPWVYGSADDGTGEDWCWQAVMVQFQIKNYTTTY